MIGREGGKVKGSFVRSTAMKLLPFLGPHLCLAERWMALGGGSPTVVVLE